MSTNKRFFLGLAVLVLLNAAALTPVVLNHLSSAYGLKMIKTKEPLLLEGPNGDEHDYVLPVGTTLYHDKSYPEGFDRYLVYLNHKGVIAHEEVPMKPEYGGALIDPLWLSNIDAETLKDLFKRFPLSKEDVAAAIKANEITKDDLADIIRSMPE
ncbi:hypothetical protein [Pseudomonas sp. B21-053]|uniref:hypothetical protein n=1 Tax=Pseudomonas sp. B21-053 TaxID=2895493 RepID=UPI00223060BC|nr:hypothetical protein [Pseudomonas sp. B21-053]UZE12726.1 hypothetical protein LOY68_03695 [Pseudomonas sp. B21-053]